MSSMDYIRQYYKVPARRGGRIAYTGNKNCVVTGVITGSHGAYLLIRLDGDKMSHPYHPTWEITYLDA